MDFKKGAVHALPICIGYVPLAIAYGVLAKSAGMSNAVIVLMSVLVYAGAAQFLSINLFASGVLPAEIVLTTFIVNSRHIVMSTSLTRKLSDQISKFARAVLAFGVTDESFSVSSFQANGKKLTTSYLFGVMILPYLFWVTGSVIGIYFADVLPKTLESSMGIALYAMFTALLVPEASKSKKIALLVLFTGILHMLLQAILTINSGWTMVLTALIGAMAGGFLIGEEEL
ncbi:MAG TPA: branched-chain amino acid ABC transporter permease [Eubacteriaceae bacterium]|nr:branched-chain amino acid ABC transporter permease [Eubacteriaceae bacterium]